jgi:hypothetical protein
LPAFFDEELNEFGKRGLRFPVPGSLQRTATRPGPDLIKSDLDARKPHPMIVNPAAGRQNILDWRVEPTADAGPTALQLQARKSNTSAICPELETYVA